MLLRLWRHRRDGVSLIRSVPRPTAGQREAEAALRRAEAARLACQGQAGEVAAAAEHLRGLRARNHFAEAVRLTLEGGR
ncbi:DUF7620 family protein [Kitasatospora kifunensis]|uniref:DUF7620 family protein n=1 Tax=Kitasatospora kifunensis TaxID=58351 RepID=UPI00406BD14F